MLDQVTIRVSKRRDSERLSATMLRTLGIEGASSYDHDAACES